MSTKIAIVGHGFVGKAVDYGFNSPDIEKIIIDPILGTSIEDLDGEDLTATFVCLPTPMGQNGHIDCQLVAETVEYLEENVYGLIIVKSTITPDIVNLLSFGSDKVVYNPEFLAERTANEDFANPQLHVFGGHPDKTKEVEELYKQYSICKPCQSFHMSAVDASFVKYGINSYLATKVAWFNQYYDMVNNHGGNFYKVLNAITHDDRVGTSHTAVPQVMMAKEVSVEHVFPKTHLLYLDLTHLLQSYERHVPSTMPCALCTRRMTVRKNRIFLSIDTLHFTPNRV